MEININKTKKNFKNFNFLQSYKVLEKLYFSQDKFDKILYIFAGPNGSGKSTLIANFVALENFDIKYINADIIATQKFSHIQDEKQRNYQSMFYTMDLVKEHISQSKSFCYETVLSHPSKLDIVNMAKQNGYKIISIFVCTSNPEINIKRVQTRVNQGGHNVPPEKIIQRYYKSKQNWQLLKALSDEYYEFDNSKEKGETMKQVNLFIPDADDLWYRAKCMSEPRTMKYNAGYEVSYDGYDYDTGCIAFPKQKWESWYKEKMGNPNFFYAYILDTEKDEFVGYVNFNKDAKTGKATMGIVIQAKYRGKGYMRPAMQKLIETAKAEGVAVLTNTVPKTRTKALKVFYDMGFVKTGQILCEKFKMPERVEEIELVL